MLKDVDLGENLHYHHHVPTINVDQAPWSNIANVEYGFSPKTDCSFVNDIMTSGASLDILYIDHVKAIGCHDRLPRPPENPFVTRFRQINI